MTITNHILAGAIIGLLVENPIAAIGLALASHFVMDALPHFGYAGKKGYGEVLRYKLTYIVAIATLVSSLLVLILLAIHGKWYAAAIGLVAALPDGVGLYNWLAYEKHGKQATGILRLLHVKLHRAIQWCERPWGIWVEAGVFIILFWAMILLFN